MTTTTLILIVDDDPELGMRLTRAVQRSAGARGGVPSGLRGGGRATASAAGIAHRRDGVSPARADRVEFAQWMAVQAHLAGTHCVLYTTNPPTLIAWDPALIAQEAPAADERACTLFALVVAKGAGGSAAQLAGMVGYAMTTRPHSAAHARRQHRRTP